MLLLFACQFDLIIPLYLLLDSQLGHDLMAGLINLEMLILLSGVEISIFVQVVLYLAFDNLTFLMSSLSIL